MAKKMLIDATQAEETRVAVLDNNGRLEEFDLEITSRQQIKGNIYLAKVTRVEPSLQAAFVNFGGNRHGFLPFSEIHPDYYRIPVADREALQAELEAMLAKRQSGEDHDDEDGDLSAEVVSENDTADTAVASEDAETLAEDATEETVAEEAPKKKPRGRKRATPAEAAPVEEVVDTGEPVLEDEEDHGNAAEDEESEDGEDDSEAEGEESEGEQAAEGEEGGEGKGKGRGRRGYRFRRGGGRDRNNGRNGGGRGRGRNGGGGRGRSRSDEGDEEEDIQNYIFRRLHRTYKIQEVIKRGQIMLVQATKEERGNKGAAMTTYLSLPGRYSVLMPNSPRSGGVSRKVHDRGERDRLREIFAKLQVPDGMSVILRTAGIGQKADEIDRDYAYLQKNWGQIRERTLASTAPALIYQEGSVIKRSIRDIFREDIAEILIAGKDAFSEAHEFMNMLVPAQAKKIKEHKGADPLFVQHRAEEQIAAIDNHTITLKSGGYLVFSPTEALVSIDINSGRATRERHIEETALNTNLEAAEEIARQLRLRDIGGLIVIDFIDMEDSRHNAQVERRLESALSKDRARIQIGRISQFGLLELSRQRLRPSLTDSHFMTCPTCQGQGMVRTTESMAVVILRAIAQEGSKSKGGIIQLAVPQAVCLYLLNQKREELSALEDRYELQVSLSIDPELGAATFRLDRQKGVAITRTRVEESDEDGEGDIADADTASDEEGEAEETASEANGEDRDDRRAGRRRGRRGGRNRRGRGERGESSEAPAEGSVSEEAGADPRPNRGRGRSLHVEGGAVEMAGPEKELQPTDHAPEDHPLPVTAEAEETPKKGRKAPTRKSAVNDDVTEEKAAAPAAETPAPAPKAAKEYETVNEAPEAPKKGWWRKVVS